MTKKKAHPEKVGRKTLYKPEFDTLALKACLLSARDADLAMFFDVDVATIHRWKLRYPSFCDAIKEGRETADANVAKSLYKRAMGYTVTETTFINSPMGITEKTVEKEIAPDPIAQIFWLKNRRPDVWRDKQDINHSGEVKVNKQIMKIDGKEYEI